MPMVPAAVHTDRQPGPVVSKARASTWWTCSRISGRADGARGRPHRSRARARGERDADRRRHAGQQSEGLDLVDVFQDLRPCPRSIGSRPRGERVEILPAAVGLVAPLAGRQPVESLGRAWGEPTWNRSLGIVF